MKLIVGLGNPGIEYTNTRHNIGYIILDSFAKLNLMDNYKEKFNALYSEKTINNEKIIIIKPLLYMNLSGEVVLKYQNYYKINSNDILIIHDDLDMKFGKIKLKQNGSSGGHKGIQNIIDNLKNNDFKRLKIGISNNKMIDTKNYVLGKFNTEEIEYISKIKEITNNILNDYLNINFNDLMSKYNGDNNEFTN